jgi:AcrR family transcriptional regulator
MSPDRASAPQLRPLPGLSARTPPGEAPLPLEAGAADPRRARILAATAELVAARGYHATTLEQIVRRARVGWPVFYKRFADKEAAFLALFEETADAALELMRDAAEQAAEPWPHVVAAALRALFTAIAAHPVRARACLVEVLTVGPVAVARYEHAMQGLRPLLLPGRALNPRAAELSDTLEDTLAGGVVWIAYQRLVAGEASRIPSLLPETLEFVLLPYLGEEETARAVERFGAPVGPARP